MMVHSKHLFIPNFVGSSLKCGYTKITSENRNLIESCYEARCAVICLPSLLTTITQRYLTITQLSTTLHRKENELAVLIQYIDRNKMEPPSATHLDIILYSREQIKKENLATGDATADTQAPWGIISVKVREAHSALHANAI